MSRMDLWARNPHKPSESNVETCIDLGDASDAGEGRGCTHWSNVAKIGNGSFFNASNSFHSLGLANPHA